ncbi:hypothetical protein [Bacillus cereus]|uniref:Uncharacterized protein n=1 Tax=Bacillus cereus 03BB108 TaxID=451709 RepID=A0AAN0SQL2_BACCE|nr:hypothetical protein [Bacillus cereus]AJI08560.1 hypothetical protein AK40_6270 [Bacillus cereus 03BB108]EDX59446.1 hypothetical protein BC03BB108_E0058 [Bacillus cereus 03BB108]QKG99285.1 hypothetical protein FOC96_03185 [Bacillus cereus]
MSQVKEAIDILEAAFSDVRERYPATLTNTHGSFPSIVNRTEYLEGLIETALNILWEQEE